MKTKERLNGFLLILAVFNFFTVSAQAQKSSELKEVKVYFHFIGTEGTESEIVPLKRRVSAKTPLRPAIEELLKEPTQAEIKSGYQSAGYDEMRFVSVKLKNGTARIDFSRKLENDRSDYNPGDLLTLRFESAVIKTARQFPAIKKVVVCVNGMNEFGIGMVIDAPLPCPKIK